MLLDTGHRTVRGITRRFALPGSPHDAAAARLEGMAPQFAQSIATDTVDPFSEREMRSFVKASLPRWIRSPAFVVEELEVCSGRARIDLAVIADRLIGIEIKAAKDDVTRLPGQVEAYSQCFEHVVLVTHESLASKAATLVPEWWGIVVAGEGRSGARYRFLQRPQLNPNLNLDVLLSLLWRDEIVALLSTLTGGVARPRAAKSAIRAELLIRIEAHVLRHATLQKLRERKDWRSVTI
jgi:hypothetical protein